MKQYFNTLIKPECSEVFWLYFAAIVNTYTRNLRVIDHVKYCKEDILI